MYSVDRLMDKNKQLRQAVMELKENNRRMGEDFSVLQKKYQKIVAEKHELQAEFEQLVFHAGK